MAFLEACLQNIVLQNKYIWQYDQCLRISKGESPNQEKKGNRKLEKRIKGEECKSDVKK